MYGDRILQSDESSIHSLLSPAIIKDRAIPWETLLYILARRLRVKQGVVSSLSGKLKIVAFSEQ
jgi:hypothetical protein